MTTDRYLAELEAHGALPRERLALFAAGSLIRGWGNDKSDLDLYVITDAPWAGERVAEDRVWAQPGTVPVQAFYVDRRRWDVEYWLEDQIDQLVAFVSHERFESGACDAAQLSSPELALIQRLDACAVVEGQAWIDRRRAQFVGSAVRSAVAAQHLYQLDLRTEDATGMLAAGDCASAVLAARMALGFAVDALLASAGEFSRQPKWRARRVKDGFEPLFAQYWALETMRGYDEADPGAWVTEVLRFCQQIAEEVQL